MSIGLGVLPLKQLNDVFSDVFRRAVKVNGEEYPSVTLINMCNGESNMLLS